MLHDAGVTPLRSPGPRRGVRREAFDRLVRGSSFCAKVEGSPTRWSRCVFQPTPGTAHRAGRARGL